MTDVILQSRSKYFEFEKAWCWYSPIWHKWWLFVSNRTHSGMFFKYSFPLKHLVLLKKAKTLMNFKCFWKKWKLYSSKYQFCCKNIQKLSKFCHSSFEHSQLRAFSSSSALSFECSQLRAFSALSVLSFEHSQLWAWMFWDKLNAWEKFHCAAKGDENKGCLAQQVIQKILITKVLFSCWFLTKRADTQQRALASKSLKYLS